MKRSELRIGNLVLCNTSIGFVDKVIPVYSVSENEIVLYHEPTKEYIYSNDCLIEPIPLTDEWLFKFGFEKTLNQYRKPTLLNKIGYNNIPFILLFLDNQYQYDDLRFRTNIKYVHQLQNLYFSLTGEELKYEN